MLTLIFAMVGMVLAAPFVVAIFRAVPAARVLRLWLVQLVAAICLWGVPALIFHGGLIPQEHRFMVAVLINLLWVALALALTLGAVAAIIRAIQLRARLRTSGK